MKKESGKLNNKNNLPFLGPNLILISRDLKGLRMANIRNDRLHDLLVDEHQSEEENIIESIYKGRVVNILKGQNIVFIDIGLDRPAFLYTKKEKNTSTEQEKKELRKLEKDTFLMVQVVKDSLKEKSFCVSEKISLACRYIVYLPNADGKPVGLSRRIKNLEKREHLKLTVEKSISSGSAIVRTLAESIDHKTLINSLNSLQSMWKNIKTKFEQHQHVGKLWSPPTLDKLFLRDFFVQDVKNVVVDEKQKAKELKHYAENLNPGWQSKVHYYSSSKPLFSLYNIELEINRLLKNKVVLASGASMVIEKTEAAWVVDVNTGSAEDKKKGSEEFILDINLEVARELVRQIRLRNMGGLILVDFIDLKEEQSQKKVIHLLTEKLALDKFPFRVLGMSDFGIVQITRKRKRKSLKEILMIDCPHCKGKGRVKRNP